MAKQGESPSFSIGPFSGIDNIHTPSAQLFQPPNRGENRLMALTEAQNVDFNNDGWPLTRTPTTNIFDLQRGIGTWNIAGRMFLQDEDILYEYTGIFSVLLTGLINRISICEHWGLIFVTDGTSHYEIDKTIVRNWGLPIPSITLAPTTGTLSPGQYLIQVSFLDDRGNEGGTSDIAVATLTTATGIHVLLSGLTPSVTHANIYVSSPNQQTTSFLTSVPIANLPYTITTIATTTADPPKTEQLTGPILSATGITSYRAFLLMWKENVVFRSEGTEPHLFSGENIMQFSSNITACEGLAGGLWIGTKQGLWWVQGDDPDKWIPIQKGFDSVVRGSIKLHGSKLPKIETNDIVALFMTTDKVIAGTSNGQIIPIVEHKYHFDANNRVGFAYNEQNYLQQLNIAVVNSNG